MNWCFLNIEQFPDISRNSFIKIILSWWLFLKKELRAPALVKFTVIALAPSVSLTITTILVMEGSSSLGTLSPSCFSH